MIPGWRRVSRALRLLLACAIVWLAAGSPGQGIHEQRAVAVMIAPARAEARAAVQRAVAAPSLETTFE
ncbi:MAG TPA: hypothetical protein VM686_05920, partial [Polyangiaceae bacterium]|nr:hypothetical protein [Polyangiaceae bacterium]